MTTVSPDLSESVSKLVELTKQLTEANRYKDLNQEEKRLRRCKETYDFSGYDTIISGKGKLASVNQSGSLV